MLNTLAANNMEEQHLSQAIDAVVKRIAPLWSLNDFVAVNPFVGYSDRPIVESAKEICDAMGAKVFPSIEDYRNRLGAETFTKNDLARAVTQAMVDLDATAVMQALAAPAAPPTRPGSSLVSYAEYADHIDGTNWHTILRTSVARYCAVYADAGGQTWPLTSQQNLWKIWREAGAIDRAIDWSGLKGYREYVAGLAESPVEAMQAAMRSLLISPDDREAYFYHLLGKLLGWASYFRRAAWENPGIDNDPLGDLLAICVCVDAFVAKQLKQLVQPVLPAQKSVQDESVRFVLQNAVENRYVDPVLAAITVPEQTANDERPAVQAVFCIDVRSEPFRRHFESVDPGVRTLGFAGFFGVSLNLLGESARCPVLLKPSFDVDLSLDGSSDWKNTFKRIQTTPAAAFSFVELVGAGYGGGLLRDAGTFKISKPDPEAVGNFNAPALSADSRAQSAMGILKNMSLPRPYAKLVMLCGHHGHSANNPHAAGLDCGACGGHGGAINARVAASLLNDPQVRQSLQSTDYSIPDDTHFLPAAHDTSIDQIALLDMHCVPSTHAKQIEQLRGWLDEAGQNTRAERAQPLGMPTEEQPTGLSRLFTKRRRDWSEVRPEWALARNASFIAARRDRTRQINLQGRAFLHEYDASRDIDSSILTLILCAPMVVASWINLQYFASTVDNDIFGSGNKTIHNRVGSVGVVLGNGGDLRTGLAMQSVHAADGKWYHEPLRLQVIVEADCEKIDAVLAAQPSVRDLVENQWIRLFALNPNSATSLQRRPSGGWDNCIVNPTARE